MIRRRRPQRDFDAEIEAHLQLEAERLREEGLAPQEAEARARRAFGNVTAAGERFYEAGRLMFLDRLRQDLRQALRQLARDPLFTAAATVSLALGIGATTAIYSFVNALMLRPYAFPELDRLVTVSELHPQQGQAGVRPSDPGYPLATGDFLDLRRLSRGLGGLAAFRSAEFVLLGDGGAQRLAGRRVSPELFEILGVRAQLGRTFRPEEADAGRDDVVVVSDATWRSRLGGAPDVVGRELVLNGRPHRIVGVMPEDFRYPPGGVEVWAPLVLSAADEGERARLSAAVIGRLAPGVSLAQAREELERLAARLASDHPRTNTGRSFRVVPLREHQAGLTGPFVALFQLAALLVLAVACANVASLLLARGLGRRREMAVRAALGASRARLVRQLLTEGLLLSGLGLLLALGVARLGVSWIRDSVPADITQWVAGWSEIQLDARVLTIAVAVALLTGLATSLHPALAAAKRARADVLRHGVRGDTGGPRRGRSVVVVAQLALSLVLLVGAALVLRGFSRLSERYEGFEPRGLLSFRVRLPEPRYPPGRPVAGFYERLLEEIGTIPGVESAAAVSHLPGDLGPVPGGAVSLRGRSAPGDLDTPAADQQVVSPDYFRAMRIRLVAGRLFDRRDAEHSAPVAIVSESMAGRLWPEGAAVGQQLKPGPPDGEQPWREVVGVVADVTQYWFDREARSTLYLPQAQAPRAGAFLVVRTQGDAVALAPAVRSRAAALDATLPLDELRTLRQVVDDGIAILRLSAGLMLAFGGVALALAILGVYGVMAQDVASRTREIGVRLALGATLGDVRRLVLKRALALAALALAIGVPVAAALGALMASRLFGVVRAEAAALAVFAGVILAVGLLAAWLPAMRAAAVAPATVLRVD